MIFKNDFIWQGFLFDVELFNKLRTAVWMKRLNKTKLSVPSKHINVESTLKQRWSSTFINVDIWLKMKVGPTYIYRRVSTLAKQRWNNVDRITLIQRRWTKVASTLKFGWKGKLNQHMFIGVEKTASKKLCLYLLYWCSLESGSITKQS